MTKYQDKDGNWQACRRLGDPERFFNKVTGKLKYVIRDERPGLMGVIISQPIDRRAEQRILTRRKKNTGHDWDGIDHRVKRRRRPQRKGGRHGS